MWNYSGKTDLDGVIYVIKVTSALYLLTSVGCTVCGSLTLYYSASDITFPYSTGSGVWTGVSAFVTGLLGLLACRNFDSSNLRKTRCLLIAFYTFVISNITFGSLHLTYSAIGYSKCYSGHVTDDIHCNPDERSHVLLMEAFNISFGVVIAVLSLFFTIYISVRRRLAALTGSSQEVTVVPCCNGRCHCIVGSSYG